MTVTRRRLLAGSAAMGFSAGGLRYLIDGSHAADGFAVQRSEAEWRKLLTPAQFVVLREHGTERPFTSPLLVEKRAGNYACAGCQLELFSSKTKFDSRTGWPSFWAPLDNAIGTTRDASYGMVRTAVHCMRCGGHHGHVFEDGPKPTGLRYCANGIALVFKPAAS